jgi:hypothetical protein
MRAADTREGMVIDLAPVAEAYGTDHDRDMARYEYALVLDDAEPAPESPDAPGIPAVLIFTDQGNYKLPADFDVPFINYDGAPNDSEED